MENEYQRTIAGPIECAGVGLHKGGECRLRIEPAPADTGFVFRYKNKKIRAVTASVKSTTRNTELASGKVSIYTVEHTLSALYGMGIDNATIVMDSQEPPSLDGSGAQIARSVLALGHEILDKPRRFIEPTSEILVGINGVYVTCLPADSFKATYILDYDHPMVGRQIFHFDGTPEAYLSQVAPARTFGFIEEVEALRKAGLAAGGSIENAVVIYEDKLSSQLRFPDEFARHKMLDLIGDMSLIGCARIRGHIVAVRSGHSLNVELAGKIADAAVRDSRGRTR